MAINDPQFGLALGGGGARGLAHIHVLEVLDELGLKPKVMAGTSIGAIYAAAYAAGLSGKDIRDFSEEALGKRSSILKRLFVYKPQTFFQIWNFNDLSRSLLRPETLLENILPEEVQINLEDLKIRTKIIATDYYHNNHVELTSGSVMETVAASIALPAVFRPVTINDRVLVDGGLTNPLPFDTIIDEVDQVVAIDVTGGPSWEGQERLPSAAEVLYASAQIPQNTIVREKMKQNPPKIFLKAPVNDYPALSFHKIHQILEETTDFRDTVKREIEENLEKAAINLGFQQV